MVQIRYKSEACFRQLVCVLARRLHSQLSCLANACLWSPGQPDNRVSVQIHHYRWALDWPKQWMSSVHVRGGMLVLMLFLKQQSSTNSSYFISRQINKTLFLMFSSTRNVVRPACPFSSLAQLFICSNCILGNVKNVKRTLWWEKRKPLVNFSSLASLLLRLLVIFENGNALL